MELAGRVYDTVTAPDNIHELFRRTVNFTEEEGRYWRRVVRMAALCHDIGHLPFSHAAEMELLPPGRSHESITADLIQGELMGEIWESMTPPLRATDIAKVAVGQKYMPGVEFGDWEKLLYEIIGGDALGVDRMDYLLRDSHHTGVAYGRFDHYRLIESVRILPASEESDALALGIEAGGIHSTEALLLARHFMFMQVYHHHVRVAYDLHLEEFLQDWLPGAQFPENWQRLSGLTDNEILSAIYASSRGVSAPGHDAANRIVARGHFRRAYSPTIHDRELLDDPVGAVADACTEEFGSDAVRQRAFPPKAGPVTDFPVTDSQGKVESSNAISLPLRQIPIVDVGYVLMAPEKVVDARKWIQSNKDSILCNAANGG